MLQSHGYMNNVGNKTTNRIYSMLDDNKGLAKYQYNSSCRWKVAIKRG